MICMWCVSAPEICCASSQIKPCVIVMQQLSVYIYPVFVGNEWLALVPSHLPHLRELCLDDCVSVNAEYVEKLKAAVPELIFTNVIL